MSQSKLNTLIDECRNRNWHVSITYQKINDFSIEIYTGYVTRYQQVYYIDGYISLNECIEEALKFINNPKKK